MKKLLTLILAFAMILSLAACGAPAEEPTPDEPNTPAADGMPEEEEGMPEEDVTPDVADEERASAEQLLQDLWNAFPEDIKPMSFGGDYENIVENEPARHTIEDGGEELDSSIGYPAELVDMIDGEQAAAVRHALNVNTFTAGCYIIADAANVTAVCDGIYDNLMNRSYLCGAPQWIVIMVIDNNYVVNAFGAEDLVYAFRDAAAELCGDGLTIVYDETMEGAHGDNGIAIPNLG